MQRDCSPLTYELAAWLFDYCKETGRLTWKNPRARRLQAGQEAGHTHGAGYRVVNVNYRVYMVHRVAWLLVYGYWPKEWPEEEIDHIDHDRSNNKISNLRIVKKLDNGKNTRGHKNNKSGVTGVHWDRGRNKWMAYIKVDHKRVHLGRYLTKDEAVEARKSAEKRFGFHCNHGKQI